jgi:hypothetical protein
MAKSKAAGTKSLKKNLSKEVYQKLKVALLSYKDDLKKNKFEKRIKKISKALGERIAKIAGKKASRKKKTKEKGRSKSKKASTKQKK